MAIFIYFRSEISCWTFFALFDPYRITHVIILILIKSSLAKAALITGLIKKFSSSTSPTRNITNI